MAVTATGFITDQDLGTALAAMLKLAPNALVEYWPTIIRQANMSAYGEIKTRLAARGLTTALIEEWSRGEEYQTDIGLFWCLVKGAGLANYDDKFLKLLDRREELDGVLIDSVTDEDDASLYVGHGKIASDDDVFSLTDSY